MQHHINPVIHSHYPRLSDGPGGQKLRQAWRRLEEDGDRQRFQTVQQEVASEVIAEQQAAGLQVVSDGLIRWYDSVSHYMGVLGGVEHGGLLRYFDTNTYFRQPVIGEELVWSKSCFKEEWQHTLKTAKHKVKLVVTGPYTLATLCMLGKSVDASTLSFYIEELAKGLSYELGGLDAEQGAKERIATVQIDEPMILQRPSDMPLLALGLKTLRTHLRTPHHMTLATFFGDAAPCYTQLQEMPVDALGFDFTYSPTLADVIRKQGSRKELQLGLLDGRNTRMESVPETAKLALQISDAAKQPCTLSTSCGLEYLPRDRAQAKLRLTAQIATACNQQRGA